MTDNLPEIVVQPKDIVEADSDNVEARADFNVVRENLHNLIKIAMETAHDAAEVAMAAQNDKYYQAASSAIKTAVEASDRLLDQHQKIKELDNRSSAPPTTVNQVVVTTAAMLEMLKQAKEKEENGQ